MNDVFLSVVIVAIIAQFMKWVLSNFSFRELLATGGMPSTHSAIVTALLISSYLETGFSAITGICLALFIIVIRDAFGVRRTAGEEGKAINKMIILQKLRLKKVEYALGHKPTEVIVGLVLGILVSIFIYLL